MKTILNYTARNFGTVEKAINNLEQNLNDLKSGLIQQK